MVPSGAAHEAADGHALTEAFRLLLPANKEDRATKKVESIPFSVALSYSKRKHYTISYIVNP